MSNEQKITTNIKVPNKDLEILKKHFPHCFDKDGKFDIIKFQQQLNTQNLEITFEKESYGLDWLGKSYARLLASDPATTLLKANETHNSKPENANSENLLIKGDNLEVLKHLANAYYEKVKMIYIDPPYNTGSDGFVYNDDRKYTVKDLQNLIGVDEEKAKRILDFTQSKSNSHSAWLTFMYPRLYIAKQLLKDDGVIFVSIDDNEVAQLRLLMDEVFGEENFLTEIAWRKSDNQANIGQLARVKEYIIGYSKIKEKALINKIPLTEKAKKEYSYKDDKGYFRRAILLDKTRGRYFFEVKTKNGKTLNGPWMIKEDEFKELDKQNRILWTSSGDEQPYGKIYLEDSNGQISNDFWDTKFGSNQEASLNLENLFGKRVFDFPKSTILLQTLISLGINSTDLILDFFAGSGTTGDAVMQLNAEDGGNRKFILVQLPEPIDPKKNKTAYEFVKDELKAEPIIFEITKERLIRAAKKIKAETIEKKIAEKQKEINELEGKLDLENNDEKIKQLKAEIKALENQDLGFKIFETMPIWEDYDFEAEQFDSSQTLFDTDKLSEDDIKALLITWKTYDGIPLTQNLEPVDLSGYTAYYGNGRLYLMNKGFTTDHLKALLEKIDSDKHFEPKSIIAFGYHFESKSLRELSENLKTYNNKKKSDIDFITRY
jgi:adenine-specific DNA-methyltransferase